MDDETHLLSRLAANHLYLAQFEPLRAVLVHLRIRDPDLALALLQTIVAQSGRFEDALWSASCPSSSHLTYLSTLELLELNNSTSAWSFGPETLRLRVEFLLLVQILRDQVSETQRKSLDFGGIEGLRCGNGDLGDCVRVLDRVLELGVKRLKADGLVNAEGCGGGGDDDRSRSKSSSGSVSIEEAELKCLKWVILASADVYDALCWNAHRQIQEWEGDDTGMAITVRKDVEAVADSAEEEDLKVLGRIRRSVQIAHLDAIKECVKDGNVEGAISRISFLHVGSGLQEEYSSVLQDLLKNVLSSREGFGDDWHAMREKLLWIYREALSSNSIHLTQMIEVIQDKLLSEAIEMCRTIDDNQIPLPVECFQKYMAEAELCTNKNAKNLFMMANTPSCIRNLYHHARVSESHFLECVMDSALSAVKREQLQEASNILALFPQLHPLVASMGWDLLPGKAATRKKLMQLLWMSKSQALRLEQPSIYGNQSDEKSCVEHLCDSLCYELDVASFVSCINSGQLWNSKSSLVLSGEQIADIKAHSDPFVENFVLERLSAQSPLRVLFDVVPGINFENAIELISMQPITSAMADWKRMQDIELMHMHYALESTILALGSIERSITDGTENHHQVAFCHLKDLGNHLKAVNNIPRKIMMVNVIISLLHMDVDDAFLSMTNASAGSCFESSHTCLWDHTDNATKGGNKMVISFTTLLFDVLRHNLPTTVVEQENASISIPNMGGKQALQWRIIIAKQFMEDWQWRLSVLQRLLPLSERQWRWKEALTVLRAAPSKLLNLCLQRAKYDIGGEAVQRFSLSAEDKATLELAEWVDSAFMRQLVEDAVSRAADGTSLKDLDFHSLQSQLGPLSTVLLCIDVAATSARTSEMAQKLLSQAHIMLSEVNSGGSPKLGSMSEVNSGGSPKLGSTYWDQILELGVISVSLRVIKHLNEYLKQDNSPSLQSNLAGEFIISSSKESHQQGQRVRTLAMLQQMIEDAHMGKRQFLSGKLHNLARAIAGEETDLNFSRGEDPPIDSQVLLHFDKDGVLGLGLGANIQMASNSTTIDTSLESSGYDIKNTGNRLFGSLSTKAATYLSRFILHIAAIGDIVDGTDTTHDFNFFSLIYEWPKDLLSQLVFKRGSTDAAEKVAEIMCADFVHEMISACVPPVYPPRSGNGWACIPVIPTCQSNGFGNKELSPSSEGAKSNCYSHTSAIYGVPLHALQLDIVRHLIRISPVRAILACVFGSSMVYVCSDSSISNSLNNGLLQPPDADRLFYEFALDQSERFPTLKRWIEMQTNLHRVSEFSVTPKKTGDDGKVRPEAKAANKRLCEHESDAESDADDIAGSSDIVTDFPDHQVSHSPKSEGSDVDSTLFLSFNWDNEEPYEKAVERLIDERKLMDALALSDRFLRDGASDSLLRLLIECEEENNSLTGQLQGFGSHSIWSTSWQYCLRLKNKQLAAGLALKYMHQWELDAALDVLTMCSCHLSESDPIMHEVLQMKQALQQYSHILSADDYYRSWQEVELECKVDPEGLALRLAGQGAVSAALEVAESAGLSIDLQRDLQGRQLVKLLTADPLSGGGPAEASRFLSSLCDSNDALAVAMGAMQLLPDLRSKQLLVHFFLKRRDGNLSDVEVSRLNSWSLGLRVLAALPLPWQQRCSSLHEHPHLILEVLLMRKQLQSASLILKEFPSLRDNNVIIAYAHKAIFVNISSSSREPRKFTSGTRTKQKTRTEAPTKSYFSSSLSNLHKEARKAFSWAPRNASEKAAPKDAYRKRKSSGLASSEKVDWEAMTGNQDEPALSLSADGQEQLPSVAVAEEWMLTRDPVKNEAVRSSHRYGSAPDIILFKELLSLCSDEFVSAKTALGLCIDQMKNVLSSQQLPENASVEKIGQAYLATETFLQGLLYSKSLLRKLIGGVDLSSIFGSGDADDAFSDVGGSSVGSQSTDQLSEALSQADTWLGRAKLLQSLLGSGIAASLDDIADKESSVHLCRRLIVDEKYSMAVYTCKKCKIDVFPVWNAWGHALIRTEHYAQARVKFKQALQLHKGDHVPVVLEIINTIEGGPPADVSAVRSMYEHLSTRAPTILDDSLSADSYLNILYMPSTFPRSEKSRGSQESSNNNSSYISYFEDGPRSNLDSIRYLECVHYLQEYARQHLLDFMFKHGHFNDACCLFFPLGTAPIPSQSPSSPGAVTSSSSPQRSDPSSTDYGSIDDLCDLCVEHSAMPALEEVVSTKMASTTPQEVAVNQYMATALSRICLYCETHKHFNHLYKFQVIKKDHIAAGLCCIQLFMNSSSQEEATGHLEHAKTHFDEALSERSKGGHSTKLITKGVRGKSAPEKISEEGLIKFSARVNMQVDVVKSFSDSDGGQWKHSLFGNPNDHETFRRRCVVAETLVEKNFDLAFQVIYEFNLPAVDIYAGVASALAEKKKGNQLTEFFRNIKGTIDDDDWDQVLGAAVNVYSYKHKERPDRLIDMLTSSHRKVLACVGCGRLKSAFQIASRSGSVADVQYVAHQALHAKSLPVLDMCKQWLAQCT